MKRKFHLGIDLTSEIAELKHGMNNLLCSFIEEASRDSSEDIKISLFCSSASCEIYERFENGNIKIYMREKTEDLVKKNNEKPEILLHPFNNIFKEIPNVINVLFLFDLTPLRYFTWFGIDPRRYNAKSIAKSSYILTSSGSSKLQILNTHNIPTNKVIVIPQPISVTRRYFAKQPEQLINKKYIFYPGAFRPHKNHQTLFHAVSESDNDLTLVLSTGETHNKKRNDELNSLIKKLGLEKKIINLEHLSRETYLQVIENSIGVISPSLAEGFGVPSLEALSLGKKCAVSNSNALAEQGKFGAFLFDPYSVGSTRSAVRYLVDERKVGPSSSQIASLRLKYSAFACWNVLKNNLKQISINRHKYFSARLINPVETLSLGNTEGMLCRILKNKKIAESSQINYKNLLNNELSEAEVDDKNPSLRFVLFFDVTRLIIGNPKSGINKYIEHLLLELLNKSEVVVIPLFQHNAIGSKQFGINPNEPRMINFTVQKKSIWAYSINRMQKIKENMALKSIFFSPFHPLPAIRIDDIKYILLIYDVLHLTRSEIYPEGRTAKYATSTIISSITKNDIILTISNFTKNELKNEINFNPSIHCIYAASGLKYVGENQQNFDVERDIDILIPYQNDPRKNFNLMLKAALLARDRNKNKFLKIVIYGSVISSHQKNEFEGFEIIYYESVSDEMLINLYKRSRVFLYLSMAEGFGMPPLEAMQFGALPIMLKNSAIQEIYRDWEYLLEDNSNFESIALVILRALESFSKPIERQLLLKIIQKFSNKYNWGNVTNYFIASIIFDMLISGEYDA